METTLTIIIGLAVCAALGFGSFHFGMWAGKMMWENALRKAGEGVACG